MEYKKESYDSMIEGEGQKKGEEKKDIKYYDPDEMFEHYQSQATNSTFWDWVSSVALNVRALLTNVTTDGGEDENFTIQDLILGKYSIVDSDYIGDNRGETQKGKEANEAIKKSVKELYYAMYTLSIMCMLTVLVYTGMRMALSTLAEDKAKYKQMLVNWLIAFCLLFVLHYFFIIINKLSSILIDMISPLQEQNYEEIMIDDMEEHIKSIDTAEQMPSACLLVVIVFYQVRFCLFYFKRFITMGFLTIIFPLVIVFYPLDKMKDGKAQSARIALNEYTINALIQPLHVLLYTIFIIAAGEIAKKAPLVAIIFYTALSRGEKIIKEVFGMRKKKTIHSISETLRLHK